MFSCVHITVNGEMQRKVIYPQFGIFYSANLNLKHASSSDAKNHSVCIFKCKCVKGKLNDLL